MRFEIFLQLRGLSFSLHGDSGVNIPRCIFGGVGDIPGVVRFEARSKVRGMANIEVGVRGSIPQNVNIMKM